MWGRLLQLCGLLGGSGTGLLLTSMIVHGDFSDMPRVASALGVPHGLMVLGMRASSNHARHVEHLTVLLGCCCEPNLLGIA